LPCQACLTLSEMRQAASHSCTLTSGPVGKHSSQSLFSAKWQATPFSGNATLIVPCTIMSSMGSGRDKRRRLAKKDAARVLEAAKRDAARAMKVVSRPPDQSEAGDHDAMVGAPLKPRPYLRSGAAAVPEPAEFDEGIRMETPSVMIVSRSRSR